MDIAKYIRDNYDIGDKLPGERLMENIFKCSRSAIRERLVVMHERGFIRVQPQSGVYYAKQIKL